MLAHWPLIMQHPCDALAGQLTPAAELWSYVSWWITHWSRCSRAAAEHFPHGELHSTLSCMASLGSAQLGRAMPVCSLDS